MKALSTLAIAIVIFSFTTTASAQKKQNKAQAKKQTISSYNSAQGSSANEITVGGRTGLTFSQFEADGSYARDYSPNAGMMLGGEINLWLTNDFGVAGQLLYVNKSATTVDRSGASLTLSASYLEIPIYAKYRFGNGDIRPYAFAGPALGFTLSSTAKVAARGQEAEGDIDGWTNTDFGLNFGAGVSVRLNSNIDLVFDLGYALGLNAIGQDDGAYGYHSGLRLMTGVMIPLR
jgi:opacity protein-like surface antigen